MRIVQKEFSVATGQRNQMIDIASQVNSVVKQSGIVDGDVVVYCPHTTAGITINENADPSVCQDIMMVLSELIPYGKPAYRHVEGNTDSHCKSSIVGCSERILIERNSLKLGTWQGIFFCEFDGPRNRRVYVQIRGE